MRHIDSVARQVHSGTMRQSVSKMRVAVLGATGGTGRHVVTTALARGHHVVALVRRPETIDPAPGLQEMVWADLNDPSALVEAFHKVDVVISALGGAAKGPTTVCTDGVRTAIVAMTQVGVDRLIAVSAHGVADTHDRSLYSMAVWAGVRDKMQDKETMESQIVQSGLKWTIVRPPKLTDRAETGKYATGVDLSIRLWSSIGRADLADFLIREAEEPRFECGFPGSRSERPQPGGPDRSSDRGDRRDGAVHRCRARPPRCPGGDHSPDTPARRRPASTHHSGRGGGPARGDRG